MDDKRHFVYELWVTGQDHPFYVGKATYKTRPYAHLTQARRGDKSLKASIIRKADNNNLPIIVKSVFTSDTEDEAFIEECRLIRLYGRRGIDVDGVLSNMTIGGEGRCGNFLTKEQREKKSKAMRGRERTQSHCKAISIAKKGHSVSLDVKNKISAALKGRHLSVSHKAAISNRLAGHIVSEDTRKKISASNKSRSISEKQRIAISKTLSGRRRSEESVNLGCLFKRNVAAEHIKRQIESGLSQNEYCAVNSISPQTFCGWKRSGYVLSYLENSGIVIQNRATMRSA